MPFFTASNLDVRIELLWPWKEMPWHQGGGDCGVCLALSLA